MVPIILVFYSCTKELQTEVQVSPKLCLNCILYPDSIVKAGLSLSQSLTDSLALRKVHDATIELWQDGKFVGKLNHSGHGKYSFNLKPISGSEYMISVKTDGCPELKANTRIPFKPSVKYELSNPVKNTSNINKPYYTYSIVKHIEDRVGPNNYWHYRVRKEFGYDMGFVYGFYDVNSLLADDFNKVIEATDELGYHYLFYLRIRDTGVDGKVLTINGKAVQREIDYFLYSDEH